MSAVKPKRIRFIEQIDSPHSSEERVIVLHQGAPHAFSMVEENGWVKITGHVREVWTHKANVVSLVPAVEQPVKSAAKGAA